MFNPSRLEFFFKFEQEGSANQYPQHERSKNLSNPLRFGKTGYLYIYTSMKWSAAEFAQAIKK